MALAQRDHRGDAGEIVAVVSSRRRFERAPVDGKPRQAAVVEGDVEDPLDARVHAAQRDLAAALIVQPAVRELQPPAVERGARREGDQEHEGRATSRGMDILYPATGPLVKTGERRSGAQTSGARLFRLRMAC